MRKLSEKRLTQARSLYISTESNFESTERKLLYSKAILLIYSRKYKEAETLIKQHNL